MKKLLATTLAATMAFTAIAPSMAFADELEISTPVLIQDAKEETEKLEIADLEVYKKQLQGYRDDVFQMPTTHKEDIKAQAQFEEKTLEMEQNIDKMAVGAIGFANIYDLSSIPQRLMLIGRLCVAMRFATTELRYKVDQAHVEIAEYIFQGLVIAVSPFHTVDDMKTFMAEFEALKQKLLGYPDMSLGDTANLYVRSDLDTILHKARFLKFNDLKDKSSDVIKELDREIARITFERLKPQKTVREIYELTDQLNAAVMIAMNSLDYRAKSFEIKEVKRLRAKARSQRLAGDRRMELAEAIYDTNKEMLKTRPSQPKVRELIATFNRLLVH